MSKFSSYFRRQYALPVEHGAWVFILSPLLIGAFTAGKWSMPTMYLIVAALSAFLTRQPISIAIKTLSGRRSRRDLPPAFFWASIYILAALLSIIGLVQSGYSFILYLTIPAIPVFTWHLYLVSRRAERRQIGVEVVGSGALALAAPAAYWVGIGEPAVQGWWLFGLIWLQSAASIVYAYLRLEQRDWSSIPPLLERLKAGRRALLYTGFNTLFSLGGGTLGYFSPWLWLSFAIQLAETIWGISRPAVGFKPTTIGFRQLTISILFTIVFILLW